MTEPSRSRPQAGQWLLLLIMAGWLALVPLVVTAVLQALNNSPPSILTQLELVAPGGAILPQWFLGLLSTLLTLGLNLLLFVPVLLTTRKHRDELPHVTATLLIAIAAFQALNALALLPSQWAVEGQPGPLPAGILISAALRLVLGLAVLLLGLGWIEAKKQDGSLLGAWRRVGLRLWFNPSAFWLALASGAVIVWPWVVTGSLGSPGTTAANLLQALPNALNEEILFRGFAFAWLWRAAGARSRGAAASLILFVAAQGATVLPYGDWGALPRFLAALFLGLLCLELTVRAGGSIWPAVIVHLLYDWFRYAFVDPRFLEEVSLWLAQAWAPLAAGALGMAALDRTQGGRVGQGLHREGPVWRGWRGHRCRHPGHIGLGRRPRPLPDRGGARLSSGRVPHLFRRASRPESGSLHRRSGRAAGLGLSHPGRDRRAQPGTVTGRTRPAGRIVPAPLPGQHDRGTGPARPAARVCR